MRCESVEVYRVKPGQADAVSMPVVPGLIQREDRHGEGGLAPVAVVVGVGDLLEDDER